MPRQMLVGLLLMALVLPGCARRSERSGTTKGAAGDSVSGALNGNYMDRQKRDMEKVLANPNRLAREGETLRASLSSDVLFESGSARLQPGSDTELFQIAEVLQRYPRTYLEITGHTDNRGSESFNQDLSERRAAAVRDGLVKSGVDGSRISTSGEGERNPIAGNDTATGRATNRRIDITIRPDEGLAREQRGASEGAPRPAPTE